MARRVNEHSIALAREWRRLGRAATAVAVFTSPALFVALHNRFEWPLVWALLGTLLGIAAFRGLIDVLAHKMIPAPSLYGAERELRNDDVVSRRRLWYWRRKYRKLTWIVGIVTALTLIAMVFNAFTGGDSSFVGGLKSLWDLLLMFGPVALMYLPIVTILFFANFLILFGPMLILGIQQIKGYEPGDADWGVKLADVRGQAEAKEEITRVVSLWQSGEEFEKAGGKRERGVLFLGPPGTGKTMLSKGIATSFNCPFVTIPGSGFAQTFIGMDAVLVRWLAFKAKRLAAKWGGQCIVFIDEIDAVGRRRQSLGTGYSPNAVPSIHDHLFYGSNGALTADGDLVLESATWRDRLFELRAPETGRIYPAFYDRISRASHNFMVPGMGGMGGGLALNQLLVVMDGIDEPRGRRSSSRAGSTRSSTRCTSSRSGSGSSSCACAHRAHGPSRSTSSGPATCRSSSSTRRSRGRAGWAATSTSAHRPGRTGATSSTCTWGRSRTSRSSTRRRSATSWRASPTATRRR